MKLNAKQLRRSINQDVGIKVQGSGEKKEIYIILDSVLDTYNIGAIFRLADAVAAKKLYLCGGTEAPPNTRIKKASINTTEWVDWEYCETALEAISRVTSIESKVKVVAIEQSKRSVKYDQTDYQFPIALVIGHESYGVSQNVLDMVDQIVEIPMFGVNVSLNVMVSLAIVLFEVIRQVKSRSAKLQ